MIKYCKNCLFPNTKPDIYFDKDDICDACNSAKRKHLNSQSDLNWDERSKEFNQIIQETLQSTKFREYDCIVPVSGGKDSTWQTHAMKVIHGLRVLAVTFDQFDQSDIGTHNLEVLKSIGVDHIHFTLNPNIVKKFVYKGFETVGDPYWVNHVGIFTIPIHIAVKFKIPLIIYGENPIFEYGGPKYSRDNMVMNKRWRQEFGGMRGYREEDMIDEDTKKDDIKILFYPDDELIEKNNIKAIFYGHFFKWTPVEHTKFVKKKYGWKNLEKPQYGSFMTEENCDMEFIDIRESIKYLKYGYGRATDQLNIMIREKLISRQEALKIVRKIDGKVNPKNITKFCNYLNISLEEYNSIIDNFVNKEIFYLNNKKEWILKLKRS